MYYVAIDLGASSGRLILAHLVNQQLALEEIHRFKNTFVHREGTDYWQFEQLVAEIIAGLAKVKARGIDACYAGVDTWGVDYGLLDAKGRLLRAPVCYRDARTKQAVEQLSRQITPEALYRRTGIQVQPFNTLYQLLVEDRALLAQAKTLLLMPDLIGYLLTGQKVAERTNASTTQLLNFDTQQWDAGLLDLIGVDSQLMPPIVESGTILGSLQRDWFNIDLPEVTFINVGSHDTASAIIGIPRQSDDWAYISSGTWSLLGVELAEGLNTTAAQQYNYTNELGANQTVRFLKNIMGMWIIQEIVRLDPQQHSFAELVILAEQETPFQWLIDVNDARFLHPDNMFVAIQAYCIETNQVPPKTLGQIVRCVYDSLALCYAHELKHLVALTGQPVRRLHIVGGGAHNQLLNQLTADVTGIPVEAGPFEATAIGNLVVQLLATEALSDLAQAHDVVRQSVELVCYQPHPTAQTATALARYQDLMKQQEEVS